MSYFHSQEGGALWSYESYKVFFGNKLSDTTKLSEAYPDLEFKNIKQVHGNRIVLASTFLVEADGHYTSNSNFALLIKTADCIPLFIVDPLTKNIMAVHAGWRGIANHIVEQAIKELIKLGGKAPDFKVVIGPHIRRQSFEVEQPVWIEIMDSLPIKFHHESSTFYDVYPNGKYKVDLEAILKAQLLFHNIKPDNIFSLNMDTLSDSQWHSYRREKENSGRNLSFIYREDK